MGSKWFKGPCDPPSLDGGLGFGVGRLFVADTAIGLTIGEEDRHGARLELGARSGRGWEVRFQPPGVGRETFCLPPIQGIHTPFKTLDGW